VLAHVDEGLGLPLVSTPPQPSFKSASGGAFEFALANSRKLGMAWLPLLPLSGWLSLVELVFEDGAISWASAVVTFFQGLSKQGGLKHDKQRNDKGRRYG
jgi:hypothetical protein